jgi:hypothetical protein
VVDNRRLLLKVNKTAAESFSWLVVTFSEEEINFSTIGAMALAAIFPERAT